MSQHGCPERLSNRSKGFQDEGPSQPTMEVLVETLTGTAFEMTVSPSDTIFAIKSKIFRVEGIPVSQQHLLYNLKELDDASSLREHAICDGARLRLVLGMRGGPISTRRLPPPPNAEPWRDIERLLDTNREEGEWAGSGCKVTVLVFRDGERVNMLRVKENHDGTYSPIDHNKSDSSSLTHLVEQEQEADQEVEVDDGLSGSLQENAVTMGKMMELRRRMENLSITRAHPNRTDKVEMQKTRSEESLSVSSLLEEGACHLQRALAFAHDDAAFAPLCDGSYTRYDYDCAFADRYTLLPPIGTRTDSDQSVQDAVAESERLKLSEALAGSILVKGARRDARDEDAAILEECLDADDCHLRQDSPQLAAKNLAPIAAAEYVGPVVGGEVEGWRAVGFGGGPHSHAHSHAHAHSHSASSLHAVRHAPAPRHHPPLSDALFSSSTSDLEKLKRNSSRFLPALSRHRNREHLHLSDEGLDLSHHSAAPHPLEVGGERRLARAARAPPPPPPRPDPDPPARPAPLAPLAPPADAPAAKDDKERKIRIRCGFCRKRLSIATVHRCRCGAAFCAPHRYAEVHGCLYDYKAQAHAYLTRANPLVSAPKLPKI
ncbi:hypothetical protein K1T71_009984 [Dendrolimus kikuchii]|uniref:Uncharacterized protein n=1 Tax=Dendrolimus kikuchii TaxID=765133 RepID=A0ACC1CTK1_9NEOP|nr:hypothetical protein K1T71_009984 [Dendrolimus kikuchii]